jgi:hypothetical protein
MCRSITLLITWYLAIPLKEVVVPATPLEKVVSHVQEHHPAHHLVPGYTPEGGGGTWLYQGGWW